MTLVALAPAGAIPEAFPGGMDDVIKSNMSRRDGVNLSAKSWLDAQQPQGNNQQVDEAQSFFDFEPQLDCPSPFVSQYPTLPDVDSTPGWSSVNHQVPSPPHSATSPPSPWPPFKYQQPPPVHNILTDIYPDSRVQHGQNTPPDDEFSNLFALPYQASGGGEEEQEKKRKRQSTSSDTKNSSPPKRSRKNGRSLNASNGQALSSAEEVRRSKFLERNRVAASKCRQKKKEWTQNLENRARDLQKENQSLRIMIDSMREEMLFIKSEMLKHTTCGCEEIQCWAKSHADSLPTSPVIKAEHSPISSPPASREGSVSTAADETHDQGDSSPNQGCSKSPEMEVLENLLRSGLGHDTSDQGIEKTLQATR
ncbi:MAG: hypothetical protein Q9200_000289 [Gallowayella weberi]